MIKKSGKSTESKKLKDAVSANKTRIKKKPLTGFRDWAGDKMHAGKIWTRGTSKKTRAAFLCLGLIGMSALVLPFVDLKGPLQQVSSLMPSSLPDAGSKTESESAVKTGKVEIVETKTRAKAIEKEAKSPVKLSTHKASAPRAEKATVKASSKKALAKKATPAKKVKATKTKVAKHKSLKGRKSLAIKDK